ncbi:MAG: hypothetical protein GC178_15335 [Flavobacteriales bacterium]|nr:hypothetical protein [Flavobacteriales bacterium]
MKAINSIFKTMFAVMLMASVLVSCDKEDEGDELHISFKSTAGYTYQDGTMAANDTITIGVEAETEKAKDPIIRFNVSESVNGGSTTTVYTEDLEATSYDHDYTFTNTDTVSGNTHAFTFTITNRDGLNKQANLTLTVE